MGVSANIRIQAEDFNLDEETARLCANDRNIGAVVSFCGKCRDEDGKLSALELEHYSGMAEAEISAIGEQAISRWSLRGLTVIHRYGVIKPGENIVLVLTASPHRQDAFDAANFVMDFLKTRAPFWKKEHSISGEASDWVDARDGDVDALKKW